MIYPIIVIVIPIAMFIASFFVENDPPYNWKNPLKNGDKK